MNYANGFRASYIAYKIDSVTWRETERFEITGGTITRSPTGLRHSADIETANYRQENEEYIRVYLDARQGGSSSRDPLFTGLACSPESDIDGFYETNNLECYSVLKAAEDVLLPRGYYAPMGLPGSEIVRDLLSVIPAPIHVIGESKSLQSYLVAENGETRLTMADKILDIIGWQMILNGNGEITLQAINNDPVIRFSPTLNDVIENKIQIKDDWYSAPNVFRAIDGDQYAVARDDSPDSRFSTVNRKREIVVEDDNCDLNTGESLSEYAERRLSELQQSTLTASYTRRFDPGVFVGEVVQLDYPEQHLDGAFRITSQKIELSHGATTEEEVEKI